MIECRGFGATGKGMVRDHNEDKFLVDNDLGLYVVCDGIGGHQSGEVAAQRAVEFVRSRVANSVDVLTRFRQDPPEDSEIIRFMEELVQGACLEISRLGGSKVEYLQMGTTLTALIQIAGRAIMGHVGDCRLYLIRDEQAYQLSDDHTYAGDLMRMGVIAPEEVKTHKYSNVLTRSVGPREAVRVDTLLFDLLPADTLLLCSDGLSSYIESD